MEQIKDRNNTTMIKYIQLNDRNLFQPQNNIFWSQERLDKYIDDHDLKNLSKMKTVEHRNYDDDNQTVDILMDCLTDNMGQLFYIYFNEKYYWAYNISKNINAGKSNFTLQLDLISSYIDIINEGGLKGTWYLERGHLIKKEFNTIHSDNCKSKENKIIEYIKINKIKNDFYYYWFGKDVIRTENGKIVTSEGGEANFTLEDYGSGIISAGEFVQNKGYINRELINFSIKNPSKDKFKFDASYKFSTPEYYIFDWNQLLREKFAKGNLEDDFEWINNDYKNAKDVVNNLFRYYPNEDWTTPLVKDGASQAIDKNTQRIIDINTDKITYKWFIFPDIFENIDNMTINYIVFNLEKLKNIIDIKNHLYYHYLYEFSIYDIIKFDLDIIKLYQNDFKLYIIRTVDYDSINFNVYYNESMDDLCSEISINPEQARRTTDWQSKMDNESISYNSGYKVQLAQQFGSNFLNSAIGFFIGKGFGWANLFANLVGQGFSSISNYLQNYYQEQDIKAKSPTYKNIPMYKILSNCLSGDFYSIRMYLFTLRLPSTSMKKIMFSSSGKIEIRKDSNSEFIKIKITKPVDQDINNIILDQKLYGNIINELTVINNPLELTENNFNYIQGTFNYSNTGGYKNFTFSELIILRDIFLKGLVILNKSNEWK